MSLNLSGARGQRPARLIPDNTVVRVLMRMKKGGHNDAEKGWTGEYAKARVSGPDLRVNEIVEFSPNGVEDNVLLGSA